MAECGTKALASANSRAKSFCYATPWQKQGAKLIGDAMFKKYNRWPVYSKFFDNMGPIPHHMHQGFEDAKLVGQEGKPESYYFPPQLNNVDNNFAYTFMGLEPGTTKAQVRKCLEDWSKGDNGILDLSRAFRLKRRHRMVDPAGCVARRVHFAHTSRNGVRMCLGCISRSSKGMRKCPGLCW